ncbi:MAG: D-2-hydroxyacid dehydrogenase [Desulfovermiculus sp.]|nr:D-2-hydroxyacid dehydrogenase [Desulfovermiculus sp.]
MTKLVFFHSIPQDLMQEFQAEFPSVEVQQCTSKQALQEALPQAEILVTFKCDQAMLDQAMELKWVQALSTGVDTLPVEELQNRSIILTSTTGMHAGHMSELAIMAMLMLARNMYEVMRNQTLRVWDRKMTQYEIAGKTLGILGLGSIGREAARKASFLGMQVIGVKNRPQAVEGVSRMYSLDDVDEVFAQSDYVVNLLPLTEKTIQCIGRQQFEAMPEGACFINLGRGGSVDEKALIQALENGRLRAAFCDVFEQEPLPADSLFWDLDNVIIMPHIGGENANYMHKAMPIIRHNLQAYLQGRLEDMHNLYQPERGY